jgi:hypothetical protein
MSLRRTGSSLAWYVQYMEYADRKYICEQEMKIAEQKWNLETRFKRLPVFLT